MTQATATHSEIRTFLFQKFPAIRKPQMNDRTPLLESGIIDSLGILDLVAFLERSFQITLQDDELTPENFANISSIVNLVEQKRNGSQPTSL